ncbi:peptide MFS transporter [Steroidobacter sp.]|uniref:peptide MFS transporter n=1 Tax=Steroidobacter sp. TaxID=1978227 RepID=UPI001A62FB2B|nr:peptide MFS transporter [Steroidobacter sp.]MBL8269264.1 peptide MFS transporter [Steroidobacter sp.]
MRVALFRLPGFDTHPRGLATLYFTELWERFSFYGMRALLVLYMVLPVEQGGLGFSVEKAAVLYGNYTMSVYLLCALGGYVADRMLGPARTVLIGGSIIATGHFVLALGSSAALYGGLACVAIGTALLKPNVTALVSRLYSADDPRRDSGFSLFYMGINVGAFIAPLLCGYLAQGEGFRLLLAASGLDPRQSWHWGFGAAGIGMVLGLAVFLRAWRLIREIEAKAGPSPKQSSGTDSLPRELSARWGSIGFFCVAATLFWAMGEQAGSSLNLFADRHTRTQFFGWDFPSAWFQSVSAAFVILLSPLFAAVWLRLGHRQPSSASKAVFGLVAASLSFVIMAAAAHAAVLGPVSPLWLLAVYFTQTLGELCLNPVGQSNVAKLAPRKLVGLTLGLWFIAIAMGSKAAGQLAQWFGQGALDELTGIFLRQAGFIAAATLLLALLVPRVNRAIRRLERS